MNSGIRIGNTLSATPAGRKNSTSGNPGNTSGTACSLRTLPCRVLTIKGLLTLVTQVTSVTPYLPIPHPHNKLKERGVIVERKIPLMDPTWKRLPGYPYCLIFITAGPSWRFCQYDSQGRTKSELLEKMGGGKMEMAEKTAILPLTKKASVAGLSS
ncbi:MAG TPA: hypothetical protein VMT62_08560 [Syntrophorhabdaceae bacterium]|nr:hypothetical protein [Syntrophorhabdaceae bacterium]